MNNYKIFLITGALLLNFQTAICAENHSLSFQEKKDIICTQCFNNNTEKCTQANIKKSNIDAKYSVYLEMKTKSQKEFPKGQDLIFFKDSDIENLIYNADKTNYKMLIKAIEKDWCYKKGEIYAGNIFKDDNNINNLNGQDTADFLELLKFKYKTPFTKEQAEDFINISKNNDKDTVAFMNNMNNPELSPELVKNLDLVKLLISRSMYYDFEHYNLHYSDIGKMLAEFPLKNKILLYLFLKKQDSKNKDDIIRILHEGPYYYRLNEELFKTEEKLPDIKLRKTDIFQLYPKNIYSDFDGLKLLILYAHHYNYDGTMICDMWQITHKMKDFSAIRDDLDNGVFKYYYDHYHSCPYSDYLEDYRLYKIMKKAGFIKEADIKSILAIRPEPCKTTNELYYGTREEKLNRILADDSLTDEDKISTIKQSFRYERTSVKGYIESYTTKSPMMQFLRLEMPIKVVE